MGSRPKLLRAEEGTVTLHDMDTGAYKLLISVRTPAWWKTIERALRLEFALARAVKSVEAEGDVVWAASEKIGIPLSLMGLSKPLVVVAHHMESPWKAAFARSVGVVERWSGIGYISDESRQFFLDYFGVPPRRLFACESAKYLNVTASTITFSDGPLMSVGVAKRDYATLIEALAGLPECKTEIHAASKYGDVLRRKVRTDLPTGVKCFGWISETEMIEHYRRARFVVVPLVKTTHSGAGMTTALEAAALTKAVVATNTGGMETFIKDGETGLLVPPHDPVALRNAIKTLWARPDLALQMGQAGRRYMERRFDPELINRGIVSFIEQLHTATSMS